MPKYKLKNVYKTLLQIWLFYYFLNTIKVYKCQLNDVEFITQPNINHENDVSDINTNHNSDSDYVYEPIDVHHKFTIDSEFDEKKNINLNVNNNIHDVENIPTNGDESSSKFTEINERQVTGQKTLHLSESPYLLRQDLEILQNAVLTIKPGVTIHFAPMVGITVHGQLKAIVSKNIKNYFFNMIHTCDKNVPYPRAVILSAN